MNAGLAPLDWAVILAYLALALAVGLRVKGEAEQSRESYFLAGRDLPWWWAGLSIAATTFAADTPLAITGLIAAKGISGNWMWLAWMGAHAGVVVLFAAGWSRSGVLTDAELVALRYSGRPARVLRWTRAAVSGLVLNCIVLGWVLRAMAKIAAPFFHWDRWLPGLIAFLQARWPADSPVGAPSDFLTVVLLLGIVAFYSGLGGIRGVVLTDLLQLSVALVGSAWLAFQAWGAVGGRAGLVEGLATHYGPDHFFLDLFPTPGEGWLAAIQVGPLLLGLYFLVQSYANVAPDGGGYMMQRLNTTPDARQARGAALVFMAVHYLLRVWPWFVVGLAALVLIPVGQEATALGGAAAMVAGDRELAYPVLMRHLLPAGVLGVMVTSLLAAFMSTVDTHLNWGASYVVNDLWLQVRPDATPREQIRVARAAVLVFVFLAVFISFQIRELAQAWGWVAILGASLATPAMLRWVWWRVNASAELGAMALGLAVGGTLILSETASLAAGSLLGFDAGLPYEARLVVTAAASWVGMVAGMLLGPPTDPDRLEHFQRVVRPPGFWPGVAPVHALRGLGARGIRWVALVAGVLGILTGTHRVLLLGRHASGGLMMVAGLGSFLWGGLGDPGGGEAP